ncbi:MAG: hypothetical protein Q4D11_03090 [Rhodospirillales bacterium]|nr:hypothetical protein [Rhodospirillales bacterium]
MKHNIFVCALFLLFFMTGCAYDDAVWMSEEDCENEAEVVVLGNRPYNTQSTIFLVNQKTGELACCQDTPMVSAEECAWALEQTCFKRVEDLPRGIANYDFLKSGTYPTRRWRDGETAPRW